MHARRHFTNPRKWIYFVAKRHLLSQVPFCVVDDIGLFRGLKPIATSALSACRRTALANRRVAATPFCSFASATGGGRKRPHRHVFCALQSAALFESCLHEKNLQYLLSSVNLCYLVPSGTFSGTFSSKNIYKNIGQYKIKAKLRQKATQDTQ